MQQNDFLKTSFILLFSFLLPLCLFTACSESHKNTERSTTKEFPGLPDSIISNDHDSTPQKKPPPVKDTISELEKKLIKAGLVNIQTIDPNIAVQLKYSTTDNFLKIDLYGDLKNAYLQPDVAKKISEARHYLSQIKPGYRLLVYDAVRPRSVQQLMWDTLKMPVREKVKYVSNPKKGSLHNFGAAVDLTIIDPTGNVLDMGTPYDHFDELAYPVKEQEMLEKGLLNEQQIKNRQLLRQVMYKAGFFNIQTEWWHFNACYRDEAMKKYKLVE